MHSRAILGHLADVYNYLKRLLLSVSSNASPVSSSINLPSTPSISSHITSLSSSNVPTASTATQHTSAAKDIPYRDQKYFKARKLKEFNASPSDIDLDKVTRTKDLTSDVNIQSSKLENSFITEKENVQLFKTTTLQEVFMTYDDSKTKHTYDLPLEVMTYPVSETDTASSSGIIEEASTMIFTSRVASSTSLSDTKEAQLSSTPLSSSGGTALETNTTVGLNLVPSQDIANEISQTITESVMSQTNNMTVLSSSIFYSSRNKATLYTMNPDMEKEDTVSMPIDTKTASPASYSKSSIQASTDTTPLTTETPNMTQTSRSSSVLITPTTQSPRVSPTQRESSEEISPKETSTAIVTIVHPSTTDTLIMTQITKTSSNYSTSMIDSEYAQTIVSTTIRPSPSHTQSSSSSLISISTPPIVPVSDLLRVMVTDAERKDSNVAKINFYMTQDGSTVAGNTAEKVFSKLSIAELSAKLGYPVLEPILAENAPPPGVGGETITMPTWMIIAIVAPITIFTIVIIIIFICVKKHKMQKDRLRKLQENRRLEQIVKGKRHWYSVRDSGSGEKSLSPPVPSQTPTPNTARRKRRVAPAPPPNTAPYSPSIERESHSKTDDADGASGSKKRKGKFTLRNMSLATFLLPSHRRLALTMSPESTSTPTVSPVDRTPLIEENIQTDNIPSSTTVRFDEVDRKVSTYTIDSMSSMAIAPLPISPPSGLSTVDEVPTPTRTTAASVHTTDSDVRERVERPVPPDCLSVLSLNGSSPTKPVTHDVGTEFEPKLVPEQAVNTSVQTSPFPSRQPSLDKENIARLSDQRRMSKSGNSNTAGAVAADDNDAGEVIFKPRIAKRVSSADRLYTDEYMDVEAGYESSPAGVYENVAKLSRLDERLMPALPSTVRPPVRLRSTVLPDIESIDVEDDFTPAPVQPHFAAELKQRPRVPVKLMDPWSGAQDFTIQDRVEMEKIRNKNRQRERQQLLLQLKEEREKQSNPSSSSHSRRKKHGHRRSWSRYDDSQQYAYSDDINMVKLGHNMRARPRRAKYDPESTQQRSQDLFRQLNQSRTVAPPIPVSSVDVYSDRAPSEIAKRLLDNAFPLTAATKQSVPPSQQQQQRRHHDPQLPITMPITRSVSNPRDDKRQKPSESIDLDDSLSDLRQAYSGLLTPKIKDELYASKPR
ncbi:uncharacterized protein LOC141913342 [Tubulanus polymorphus]|uniref:uncharacterized protein LOC141913342 n=1 Tax=Tubulanus polymorphus TaxID=672921 RepID=UPI003DA3E867